MKRYLVTLAIVLCLTHLAEQFVQAYSSCNLRSTSRRQGLIVEGLDATSWCKDLGYAHTAWHLYKKDCKIHCRSQNETNRRIFSPDGEECETSYKQRGTCMFGTCLTERSEVAARRGDFAGVQIKVVSAQVAASQDQGHECRVLIRYVNSPGSAPKPFEYDDDICDMRTRNVRANTCIFQDSCTLFPLNRRTTIQVSLQNDDYMEPSDSCRRQIVLADILDQGAKEISFACPGHRLSLDLKSQAPIWFPGMPSEAPSEPDSPEESPASPAEEPAKVRPPVATTPASRPIGSRPTQAPESSSDPSEFEVSRPPGRAPKAYGLHFRPWFGPSNLRPPGPHHPFKWRRPYSRQRWLDLETET